jgi:hypothetical protein
MKTCYYCPNTTEDDKLFVALNKAQDVILCEDCILTCSGLIAKFRKTKPKLVLNKKVA